ncbi:MAG TPA: DUF4832 domain-containing protein [Candidatus Limiplasma sp.]|nr:DUF4832 domain-containing protein [Candidatus Limiplasma sp.]
MGKNIHVRRITGLLAALLFAALCTRAFALSESVSYPASGAELVNPFIGSAVWANDTSDHEQPFTLVYANLTWADFEPEQGVYDFASFEAENQFARWRAEGKHVILRFVMDVPGDKRHRDIPDWLYEATDGAGRTYNISYGRGFSPDYENPILIQAHAAAIAALGERYGDDPFIAYVEIGSLGHWGEWHVYDKIGDMPSEAVQAQYVLPYIDAFDSAYLLMRRPFAIAAEYSLGLFNDTAGLCDATELWLQWIESGGDFETSDGVDALVPMPDAWQTAPIGGELSTSVAREALLDEYFTQTLSLFQQSHTSWIGPGSFSDIPRGGALQAALDTINRTVGYRLRITRCDAAETEDGLRVTLSWTNDGIAPFYFDWQPTLAVTAADGGQTLYPLPLSLLDVLPDTTVTAAVTLTGLDLAVQSYTLSAAILNPATGTPGVALAMQAQETDLWYTLMELTP